MNLKNLSDGDLHLNTKSHVERERELTTVILHHLKENDRRRLFSKLGYKSLHEYAEKELKYPGEQAYRRISAMRLLRELPEMEAKVESGELSLTHLSEAKRVFNKVPTSRSGKLQLLERLCGSSTREAQKILVEISPEATSPDRVRTITTDQKEYKFLGSHTLDDKLQELAGCYAHTQPGISLGELVEKLADLALEQFKNSKAQPTKAARVSKAAIYRQVWKRDNYRCTQCSSTYAVQVDHRITRAHGGSDSLENLRLLCRKCNQRAAIDVFGLSKMSRYLRSPTVMYGLKILGAEDFRSTS